MTKAFALIYDKILHLPILGEVPGKKNNCLKVVVKTE